MKPAPFEHHAPATLEESVGLLAQFGEEGKVLAGGQNLVPLLALRLARVEHLIDVNRVAGISWHRPRGWLAVGGGGHPPVGGGAQPRGGRLRTSAGAGFAIYRALSDPESGYGGWVHCAR
jgi:hypothetical protein